MYTNLYGLTLYKHLYDKCSACSFVQARTCIRSVYNYKRLCDFYNISTHARLQTVQGTLFDLGSFL